MQKRSGVRAYKFHDIKDYHGKRLSWKQKKKSMSENILCGFVGLMVSEEIQGDI